jgi:general stress protein YciG
MAASDNKQTDDHKMSRSEAGKLGGEKVRDERGSEFYSEIGSQQGKENNPGNFANDKEKARRAGEIGGSKSTTHDDNTATKSNHDKSA